MFNMDQIMKASLGESSSSIRATFKKTINVRQYESENIEISTTLELDHPLNGVERMIIAAILQAQLEYDAFIQLVCKGVVTNSELNQRKNELEQDINLLTTKGEQLLGKPMDYLFEMVNNGDCK